VTAAQQVFPGETHRVTFVFSRARTPSDTLTVVLADAAPEPAPQYVDLLRTVDANVLFVVDDFGPYAGDEGYPGCWYLGEARRTTFGDDVAALVAHAAGVVGAAPHRITAAGVGKGAFGALSLATRHGWGSVVAGFPQVRLGHHLVGDLEEVATFVAGGHTAADRRWLDARLLDALRDAGPIPDVRLVVDPAHPSYAPHVLPLLDALERRAARVRVDVVTAGADPAAVFGERLLHALLDGGDLVPATIEDDLKRHASRRSPRPRTALSHDGEGIRCFLPAMPSQKPGVYAGVAFDATPFALARLRLSLRRPQEVEGILVDALAADGRRLARWRRPQPQDPLDARGPATLLLSAEPEPPLVVTLDEALDDVARLDVMVKVRDGGSADFTIHGIDYVPPAPDGPADQPLPMPIPDSAAAGSRRVHDPAASARRVAALAARGEFPPPARLPDGPVRRPNLKVACLLDRFSELGFRYEFDYVDFTPDDFREVIDRERPDLLLVESIWRGKDEAWNKLMVPDQLGSGPTEPVRALVRHCRDLGIPTVFWNKEDPPNFEHFIRTAALFDHVFTTDESCVERYVPIVGHDRVGVLPFASQPRLHNPVGAPVERPLDIAFLGTFYGRKHADRKRQMEMILDPAREFDVHIYSRVEATGGYAFPDKYVPHLIGTVPYEQVLGAYRSYRVLLNVNSVPNSRTMCARRVFEILGCGGTVVSGPSPAIEAVLGPGLVHESDAYGDTRDILHHVLGNEGLRERVALTGIRRVSDGHTYSDRVDTILDAVGLRQPTTVLTVSLVAPVADIEQAEAMVRVAAAQSRPPAQLALVTRGAELDPGPLRALAGPHGIDVTTIAGGRDDTPADALARAAEGLAGDLVGLLAPGAVYGPHYLEDLINAVDHSDADVVGKGAHYRIDGAAGWTVVDRPQDEHQHVEAVCAEAMLVRRALLDRVRLGRGDDLDAWQRRCHAAGAVLYAADRFNFVRATPESDPGAAIEAFGPGAEHAIA